MEEVRLLLGVVAAEEVVRVLGAVGLCAGQVEESERLPGTCITPRVWAK